MQMLISAWVTGLLSFVFGLIHAPLPLRCRVLAPPPLRRKRPKVCVLRQEGSNGDREMLSAFHEAGLEAWDVNMNDLLQGRAGAGVRVSCADLLHPCTY